MRFFEYEAREVVKRAGIPVTDYGFTTDAGEAREIAQRIGGPTVIKSQVLTGGRMKAGGVKFADNPEEAEAHAREILHLRHRLNEIYVRHTGQSNERIQRDTERDFYMGAEEGRAYGLIDEVVTQRKDPSRR